jgi:leucyl aminopeptidase (aminopeptidase T)
MSGAFAGLIGLADLRQDDCVLVISDTRSDEQTARMLFEEMLDAGADVAWSLVRAREKNGDELPVAVRASLLAADLVLLLTSWSPSHSTGVIEAMGNGARVISMPGLHRDLLAEGGATADYAEVKRITDRFGEFLAAGHEIELSTVAGTQLKAQIGGLAQMPLLDGGPLPREVGGLGNFPAGEAAICPVEGTAEGRVVVDMTSSTTKHPITNPIIVTIAKGVVTDIEGGPEADDLRAFLDAAGPSSRVVAEIALGSNPRSLNVGLILEDEKRLGSAHVGLGNSRGFGGTNDSPVHIDVVFDKATAVIDGITVLDEGRVTPAVERESLAELPPAEGQFERTGAETEVRDGRLNVLWHEVRGMPIWSQVGNDDAARASAELLESGSLVTTTDTMQAQVLTLLERYRVVKPRVAGEG